MRIANLTGEVVEVEGASGTVRYPPVGEAATVVPDFVTTETTEDGVEVTRLALDRTERLPPQRPGVLLIVNRLVAEVLAGQRSDLLVTRKLSGRLYLVRLSGGLQAQAQQQQQQQVAIVAAQPEVATPPEQLCGCIVCRNIRDGFTSGFAARVATHASRLAPPASLMNKESLAAEFMQQPERLCTIVSRATFCALGEDVQVERAEPVEDSQQQESPAKNIRAPRLRTTDTAIEEAADAVYTSAVVNSRVTKAAAMEASVCSEDLWQPAIKLLVADGRLVKFGNGVRSYYVPANGGGGEEESDAASSAQ